MARQGYDKIVIETFCPGFTVVNLASDENYAKLLEAEKNGTLPEPKAGNVARRAAYQHKKNMMYEIVEYDDGTTEERVKESIQPCPPADERGRLFLDLNQKDLAKKILVSLKAINKNVTTDPISALSEEEIMGPPPEKRVGGRPSKKKVVKVYPAI
jgi:hypothetical protein